MNRKGIDNEPVFALRDVAVANYFGIRINEGVCSGNRSCSIYGDRCNIVYSNNNVEIKFGFEI